MTISHFYNDSIARKDLDSTTEAAKFPVKESICMINMNLNVDPSKISVIRFCGIVREPEDRFHTDS